MSAARELDQSDFDLERFVDMFDEAMTSADPRVVETLRKLMMIVTLTRPESSERWSNRRGPLRRMMDDINNMHRRIETLEQRVMSDRESVKEYHDRMAMTGAKNMAAQIDADVLKQLAQRDYGYKGLPKGLLEK